MGISILGGIVWRRANRWGAIASLVVSLTVNFALYAAMGQRLDHWDANVFLLALMSGILALVLVSWITPEERRDRVASFFGRLDTPAEGADADSQVDLEEPSPADIRRNAEAGRQSLLVNLLRIRRGSAGLPFWHAFSQDLRGFLIGSALAIGLVLLTWAFLAL